MASLRRLQRDLQQHLLGESSAITQAIVDAPPLPAAQRLAIYGNAYRVRLIDALGETYPVLHAVLGDEDFAALGAQFVAAQPSGSGITLDYGQPRAALPFLEQLGHDSLAGRVKLAGEPFQLFFTPQEIAVEFSAFQTIEDLGREEINARYFANRKDDLKIRGSAGRLFSAWLAAAL